MSAYLHLAELTNLNADAERILGRMKHRLDKWANRADAKPDIINARKRELVALAHYLRESSQTLEQALQDNKAAYARGLQEGLRRKERDHSIRGIHYSHGKEVARATSISRAHQKWADHF